MANQPALNNGMAPKKKVVSQSFSAVADKDAKVLILGSMPGVRSLDEQEYYAHPRNHFWPIMEALFGVVKEQSYPERLLAIKKQKIALWDVMQYCEREGSLDSSIKDETVVVNNFSVFLEQHKHIEAIFFNGNKSAQTFKKYAQENMKEKMAGISLYALTSTSPANARLSFDEKLLIWQIVKDKLLA